MVLESRGGAASLGWMHRRAFISGLAVAPFAGALPAFAQTAPVSPAPLFYYAGQAGRLTSDRDRQGGNPFASALCEVLPELPMSLETFGGRMALANSLHSRGWQQIQMPRKLGDPALRLGRVGQSRKALVLINADYSKSDAYSLPGARFDAKRVPAALEAAGLETTLVLDAGVEGAREAMATFARASSSADVSFVYVGGHGLQHKRVVYWMMGDYPERDSRWLASHAIALDEIGASGRAREANLVLYASCRDDPFLGK
jgi:hypothetical protein